MAEPETARKDSTLVGAPEKLEEKDPENRPSDQNPLLSLLAGFLQLFNLKLPEKPKEKDSTASVAEPIKAGDENVGRQIVKPAVVKFPRQQEELSSLKVEAEEAERDTNPVVLWQVYAIGAFFIVQWGWKRWNERRGRRPPSNENAEPPPDHL